MVVVEFSNSFCQNLNTEREREREREGGRDGISSNQLAMTYEFSIDLTVITISNSHNRTERESKGVGWDILISKKLFLELCGPRGNSFR